MRKLILIALVAVLVVTLSVGAVLAGNSIPASKAAAAVSDITWLESNTMGGDPASTNWTPVIEQQIKTGNKDLFVDVSLLCGIFTQTEVTVVSAGGEKEAEAVAYIKVRVKAVDDEGTHYAYPSAGVADPEQGIVFAERHQDLWAQLNTYNVSDNMTIGLALDTMDAHSFNFIIPDLRSGVHTIVVEAMTFSDPAIVAKTGKGRQAGETTAAWAGIGFGSVTIEEVRMVKDANILVDLEPK